MRSNSSDPEYDLIIRNLGENNYNVLESTDYFVAFKSKIVSSAQWAKIILINVMSVHTASLHNLVFLLPPTCVTYEYVGLRK